jgi:hypothetical protein
MKKQQLKEEVRKVLKEMLSETDYKRRLGIRPIDQRDIDIKKEICATYKSNMSSAWIDDRWSEYRRFKGDLKKCEAELAQLEKTFEEEQKGN